MLDRTPYICARELGDSPGTCWEELLGKPELGQLILLEDLDDDEKVLSLQDWQADALRDEGWMVEENRQYQMLEE